MNIRKFKGPGFQTNYIIARVIYNYIIAKVIYMARHFNHRRK